MTRLWDQPGVPHKGWRCIDVVDNRPGDVGPGDDVTEGYPTCEMCGQERIRFVHLMEHPDFPQQLDVGCFCAEKMEGDYTGPRRREATLRSKAARRAKWLTRRWNESAKGNRFLRIEGFVLTVFRDSRRPGHWKCSIQEPGSDKAIFGTQSHPSEDAARLALFEKFWSLRRRGTVQ